MDRRSPDQDLMNKMQDVVELIYILNKLTNNDYNNEYSKDYLISMLEDMDSIKSNYDKYKYRDFSRNSKRQLTRQSDRGYMNKNEGIIDKIIFYLKSLNE